MFRSKCWRKSLGERGCRVYVFERKPGGTLYREVYLGGSRAAPKKSLGHRNKERAEADGYRLLAALKTRQDALNEGTLTLEMLFDNYIVSPAHHAKKPRTRREDERKLQRVIQFFGPKRNVLSLCDSDIEQFKQARLRGDVGPTDHPVRSRTVEADLVAVRTLLNWATRQRNGTGRPLLEYSPLRGVKLPVEKNPRRPVETYDRYLKLQEVAGDVDWRLPAALALAESTGQRISSILKLKRRDIDFGRAPDGWLRFRAEYQKTGYDHQVPLTKECSNILRCHAKRLPDAPTAWLFPRQRRASSPVDTSLMSKLLRTAYERAGLEPQRGGLWHPWRRKWATERKNMPLKDVAHAGGWRDPNTIIKCYQQPDEQTLMRVMLEAPKLFACGTMSEAGKVTPILTPRSEQKKSDRSVRANVVMG